MDSNKSCDVISCPCKNYSITSSCWTAAEQGDYASLTKRVNSNKFLINKFDTYGYSPLHYASQHDHLNIVTFLLQSGANPDANKCGATPLHRAGLIIAI